MKLKRAVATTAAVLVTGLSLSACGGDDGDGGDNGGDSGGDSGGAPESASTEEFCTAFEDFYSTLTKVDPEADTKEQIQALKDAVEDVREVGTPEDIPEDARAGYELTTEAILDVDDDATEEELGQMESELSEDEQAQSAAFDSYLSETCPDLMGGQ